MKIQFLHNVTDATETIESDFYPSIGDIIEFEKEGFFISQMADWHDCEYDHLKYIVTERNFSVTENGMTLLIIITEKN